MNEKAPKLSANFKNRHVATQREKTAFEKYEDAVEEYKSLLKDKTHPSQRTDANEKNELSILNRLLLAADNLDVEEPGKGIFGLLVVALRSSLFLKDKNLELEVKVRDLENIIRKMKKNGSMTR